jgi:hypothetical protein
MPHLDPMLSAAEGAIIEEISEISFHRELVYVGNEEETDDRDDSRPFSSSFRLRFAD